MAPLIDALVDGELWNRIGIVLELAGTLLLGTDLLARRRHSRLDSQVRVEAVRGISDGFVPLFLGFLKFERGQTRRSREQRILAGLLASVSTLATFLSLPFLARAPIGSIWVTTLFSLGGSAAFVGILVVLPSVAAWIALALVAPANPPRAGLSFLFRAMAVPLAIIFFPVAVGFFLTVTAWVLCAALVSASNLLGYRLVIVAHAAKRRFGLQSGLLVLALMFLGGGVAIQLLASF